MEARRLDHLARALATASSRRRVLAHWLAAVLVGALPGTGGRAALAQESPPIVPHGDDAGEADETDDSAGTERTDDASTSQEATATPAPSGPALPLDYFALGDSIASGHGLLDDDGPDPDIVPGSYQDVTCRDCDSDQCERCEAAGCDPCQDRDARNARDRLTCADENCDAELACQPCCRRSSRAYGYHVATFLDQFLRDHPGGSIDRINFPPEHHLACTGGTSLSPLTLDEVDLGFTSPVPNETLVLAHHRNPGRLLVQQVSRALESIEQRTDGRPVLVSITIGANDMEFARIDGGIFDALPAGAGVLNSKTFGRLYLAKDYDFEAFATARTGQVRQEVRAQIERLIAQENVYVALTEVPNPFNAKSAMLKGVNLLPPESNYPYQRIVRAAKLLNEALHGAVTDLGSDRVAIAPIHDAFEKHKAPRPLCGSADPPTGVPAPFGESREEGTWIQHPLDPRSNSYSNASDPEWSGDCIHPNDDGAAFIARQVARSAEAMVFTPRFTAAPQVSEIGDTSVVISWSTSLPTAGTVEYGVNGDLGSARTDDSAQEATDHALRLEGLQPGQTYSFRVRSGTATGEVVSDIATFTTRAGLVVREGELTYVTTGGEIWAAGLTGGNARRLIEGLVHHPSWSRDGTRLAYVRRLFPGSSDVPADQIEVVDREGGEPRIVVPWRTSGLADSREYEGYTQFDQVRWAPDDTALYYWYSVGAIRGGSGIIRHDLESGEEEGLPLIAYRGFDVAVDGTVIYVEKDPANTEFGLTLLTPDGEVSTVRNRGGSPAWSASGELIALADEGIWIMTRGDAQVQVLAGVEAANIAWSSDDAQLAFDAPDPDDPDTRLIWTVGQDGSDPQSRFPGEQPAWAPPASESADRLAIVSPPVVSEITATTAIVSWTMNRPAVGSVDYGRTTGYGRSRPLEEGDATTRHRIELDNLDPDTTYHFKARATSGREVAESADNTFRTAGAPLGHLSIAAMRCEEFTETAFSFVPGALSGVDGSPACEWPAFSVTIANDAGEATTHEGGGGQGPAEVDLPLGAYTITDNASGVTASFVLEVTPTNGSCGPEPVACLMVRLLLPSSDGSPPMTAATPEEIALAAASALFTNDLAALQALYPPGEAPGDWDAVWMGQAPLSLADCENGVAYWVSAQWATANACEPSPSSTDVTAIVVLDPPCGEWQTGEVLRPIDYLRVRVQRNAGAWRLTEFALFMGGFPEFGQPCVDGEVSDTCTADYQYQPCGNADCLCGATVEGDGLCLSNQSVMCDDLIPCFSSAECGADQVCAASAGCVNCPSAVCWPVCPDGSAPRSPATMCGP